MTTQTTNQTRLDAMVQIALRRREVAAINQINRLARIERRNLVDSMEQSRLAQEARSARTPEPK